MDCHSHRLVASAITGNQTSSKQNDKYEDDDKNQRDEYPTVCVLESTIGDRFTPGELNIGACTPH